MLRRGHKAVHWRPLPTSSSSPTVRLRLAPLHQPFLSPNRPSANGGRRPHTDHATTTLLCGRRQRSGLLCLHLRQQRRVVHIRARALRAAGGGRLAPPALPALNQPLCGGRTRLLRRKRSLEPLARHLAVPRRLATRRLHQRDNVSRSRARERGDGSAGDAIPALQHRHEAALAVSFRQRDELVAHPLEVHIVQSASRERIVRVRIEAGGDEDQIWRESVERRQQRGQHRPPPHCAWRAQWHGRVVYLRRLYAGGRPARARVEEAGGSGLTLGAKAVDRAEEDVVRVRGAEPRLEVNARQTERAPGALPHLLLLRGHHVLDAGFGAVAVMHIEVDNGDATHNLAVDVQCVRSADGDVGEQTETRALTTHRAARTRVMPRGAHRAKGVARLARAAAYGAYRFDDCARTSHRRTERVRRHFGVLIHLADCRDQRRSSACPRELRALNLEPTHVLVLVHAQHVGDFGVRCRAPSQLREEMGTKRTAWREERPQTLGTLWLAVEDALLCGRERLDELPTRCSVQEGDWVREQQRRLRAPRPELWWCVHASGGEQRIRVFRAACRCKMEGSPRPRIGCFGQRASFEQGARNLAGIRRSREVQRGNAVVVGRSWSCTRTEQSKRRAAAALSSPERCVERIPAKAVEHAERGLRM
mmetsp:Transcript_31049/g.72178  ORF Transcript_31049/g.72178 Transcript_31049/m.72178 type:complete len:648 (-) Transcript_31049:639-2582(-)